MNRTVKLLSVALVVLVVFSATETYLLTIPPEVPPTPPIRVACIGDSITRGNEYTVDLWSMLGANYTVGDFGIGGATVNSEVETGYINETAFQVAKDYQPDIVIIMLGTNDANPDINQTTGSFIADFTAIITAFQELDSKPQIYLVLPPPIYENVGPLTDAVLTQKVIPAIEQLAEQLDLPLIDVHTPLLGHEDFFIDGIHPKVSGAIVIAQTIFVTLQQTLTR
jgi:lysophospholipase L1-like esterase